MVTAMDLTILVVEDDSALRNALATSLRRRGYRVVTAADMRQARHKLRVSQPHYAVIDFNLGGAENGLDLIREFRAVAPDVGLVLVTGFATVETAVAAMQLGALDVLIKPVDAGQIVSALGLSKRRTKKSAPRAEGHLKSQEMQDIRKGMALTGENISETARRLGMHRRSLQRKLARFG